MSKKKNCRKINDHKKIEEIKEANTNRDFSNLPDEILCQIISYLPFISAVETSLLSTQWKHLWKKNLEENGKTIDDAIDAISRFVNDFDEIHQLRKVFGLKFNYANNGGALLAAAAVTSSTHKKTLHLDFSGIQPKYFSSEFLLLKLKSIHLMSVPVKSFKVPESTCLESLRISKCNRLGVLDIKNAGLLKCLTILDCPKFESLNIEGSELLLSKFRYRGTLNTPMFGQCCNFGRLDDAMLCFRQGPGSKHDTNYINNTFVLPIIHVDYLVSLTICRWVSERWVQQLQISSNKSCCFHSLKSLWWIDSYDSQERYNSNALMCFLDLCCRLQKLYLTIDPKSNSMRSTCQYKESEKRYCLPPKAMSSLVVKLEGFEEERDVMALVWRLNKLKLFHFEPFIIVKSHWSDCFQFIGNKLNKKGKLQYVLKDGVRDAENICPNHVHMNL